MKKSIKVPGGYGDWLEYAVETAEVSDDVKEVMRKDYGSAVKSLIMCASAEGLLVDFGGGGSVDFHRLTSWIEAYRSELKDINIVCQRTNN